MDTEITSDEEQEDHEVYACYTLTAWSRKHEPTLTCSCGFTAIESSWEDAGAAFDEHVAQVSKEK